MSDEAGTVIAEPAAAPAAAEETKSHETELPIGTITKLAKAALPPGGQVGKQGREALSKAASTFIVYITAAAHDIVAQHKRKTISAQDLLTALNDCDFEDFVEQLQPRLAKYREEEQAKKQAAKAAKAASASAAASASSSEAAASEEGAAEEGAAEEEGAEEQAPAKRARVEPSEGEGEAAAEAEAEPMAP